MTRRAALLLIVVSLALSSATPFIHKLAPATFVPREPTWTIYEVGEYLTGTAAWKIEGFHFAESSKGMNYNHPDPNDRGDFGFSEKYRAYFEGLFGAYDPMDPRQMAIRTGQLYQHNLKQLGDERAALAAHCQGVGGVRADGINWGYVAKVESVL